MGRRKGSKCPSNCTCGLHSRTVREKCALDCKCRRHTSDKYSLVRLKGGVGGYKHAHNQVVRARGKAAEYTCECGRPAAHWAFLWRTVPEERWLLSKIKSERMKKSIYSLDPNDYAAMCHSCAHWYDRDDRLRQFMAKHDGERFSNM